MLIIEAEFVLSPEVVKDVSDIVFEGLWVPAFELHPGMFDLVPETFDAVEFGAVGRQKVQRDALGLEQLDEGADLFGRVDGRVVDDDGQGAAHMFFEQSEPAHEEVGRPGLPQPGAKELARGQQRAQHVEPLAPLGLDQVAVLAAARRPAAAQGVRLHEAHFIGVGQHDLAGGGSLVQRLDLYGRAPEGGFIATFFKEYRARFHTRPASLSVPTRVLR